MRQSESFTEIKWGKKKYRWNINQKTDNVYINLGLHSWLSGKESAYYAEGTGDADSIPELRRSPREGNYSTR